MLDADIMQKLELSAAPLEAARHAVRGFAAGVHRGFYQLPPSRKAPRSDQWAPVRVRLRRVALADFRAIALSAVLRQRDPRRWRRCARSGAATCRWARASRCPGRWRPLPPNAEGVLPTRLHSVNANVDAENRDELAKPRRCSRLRRWTRATTRRFWTRCARTARAADAEPEPARRLCSSRTSTTRSSTAAAASSEGSSRAATPSRQAQAEFPDPLPEGRGRGAPRFRGGRWWRLTTGATATASSARARGRRRTRTGCRCRRSWRGRSPCTSRRA